MDPTKNCKKVFLINNMEKYGIETTETDSNKTAEERCKHTFLISEDGVHYCPNCNKYINIEIMKEVEMEKNNEK